jgi:hypothetical protein
MNSALWYVASHRLSPANYVTQIFNDASTFRSEIKKRCVALVPSLYDFHPPRGVNVSMWIKDRADELIRGAKFLRGLPNSKVMVYSFKLNVSSDVHVL